MTDYQSQYIDDVAAYIQAKVKKPLPKGCMLFAVDATGYVQVTESNELVDVVLSLEPMPRPHFSIIRGIRGLAGAKLDVAQVKRYRFLLGQIPPRKNFSKSQLP
jgi:hypothetical protein